MIQTFPCPACHTPISINTNLLLGGVQFTCTGCGGQIGLASSSKPVVSEAMAKLEEFKAQVQRQPAESG